MKYAVDIYSGAMVYIPSFINISSIVRKLIGGYTDTQTAWCSHIFLFILQNK
jgi:hypothetical protein